MHHRHSPLTPLYISSIWPLSDHPIWLLAFGVMGVIGSVIASSTLTDCCVAGDEGAGIMVDDPNI
jgi:hypothetical protein